MADAVSGFRDLDHVRGWLQQFRKPEVATSLDEVSLQALATLGQALEVVAAEVAALKAAGGVQHAEPGAAADGGGM